MLIQLTSAASGKPIIVNTADIHRISEPQPPSNPRDAERYVNSRTILEYNRPHPTKPDTFAFDFVREEVTEVSAMIFGTKA